MLLARSPDGAIIGAAEVSVDPQPERFTPSCSSGLLDPHMSGFLPALLLIHSDAGRDLAVGDGGQVYVQLFIILSASLFFFLTKGHVMQWAGEVGRKRE